MKTDLILKDNIGELEQSYIEYMRVSDSSIKSYRTGIKKFFNYLIENGITQPSRNDIYNFRDSLIGEYKITTINTYLISIKSMFAWLEEVGKYKNIAKTVKQLSDTNTHKREALTEEQVKILISKARNTKEKMLLSLAIGCGLRVNEIANVRLQDFKYENNTNILYVLGKRRKDRVDFVVVPDNIIELKDSYVQEYGLTEYLFETTQSKAKNEPITVRTIERMITSLLNRAGLKKDTIVAHSLRHTFATIAIKKTDDIRLVSKALRHKNLSTTNIYLHDIDAYENKCSNLVADCFL